MRIRHGVVGLASSTVLAPLGTFTVLTALLATGCNLGVSEAWREYITSLKLSKIGRPLEEQLLHADRAVLLEPTSATYLERRADLRFGLERFQEARADYDRAVALADRPYLRFERANALCALGDLDAALADLDRAILEQPENDQFYPRRALVRLAAGRVTDARADVEHAIARSRGAADEHYARAALLLIEGKPAVALADLDFAVTAWPDSSHAALPRTLRRLAWVALEQPERAAAEFDPETLLAAQRWPELGPRYWMTVRGCSNAFIPVRLGDLVAAAESQAARPTR